MSYIGATYRTAQRRWGAHCSAARAGLGALLHADIRRFGEGKFKIQTLFEHDDDDILAKREKLLIKKHRTLYPKGYNLTTGGDEEFHVERTKRKMSRSRNKLLRQDPNLRAKIGLAVSLAKSTDKAHKITIEAAHKSWKTRRKNFTADEISRRYSEAAMKRDNTGNAKKGWETRRRNITQG